MIKKRPAKDDDQDKAQKAFEMLNEYLAGHSEIEACVWVAALLGHAVDRFQDSGLTYEEFCTEMDRIKRHYKTWWDDS
jgi:hypothetical protein